MPDVEPIPLAAAHDAAHRRHARAHDRRAHRRRARRGAARGVGRRRAAGSCSAAARTSSSATSPSTARSCACARRASSGCRLPGPASSACACRPGTTGTTSSRTPSRRARGHRGDVGHPRHGRRRARAEHRRLRAGDRPDARRGRASSTRATGEISTVPADELGLGFRTSVLKQHYGSVAAAARRDPLGHARARRGRPRRSPVVGEQLRDARSASIPATRRVARVGARPRARDPAPQGHGARRRPTPTRTARARSSRTRSCRHPSPARCPPSARAGRSTPDLDPVPRDPARRLRRLRSAHRPVRSPT